jgi:hypothetical protein
MKKCTGCDVEKDFSQFHKNRTKKDGLASYCKDCNTSQLQVWQQDNIEFTRKYSRDYQQRKRENG